MALKEVSDKLKILGHKQVQLEQFKVEAIQGEDFQSAKAIKNELDNIKAEIGSVDPVDPFGRQRP